MSSQSFRFFSLPCTEFQNKYNLLHLRTDFLEYGNWAQGLRCVLGCTVGGCASGGKNLERQRELPCTHYHRLNTAFKANWRKAVRNGGKVVGKERGFVVLSLHLFYWSLMCMILILLGPSPTLPAISCPLKEAEFSKKQDPASQEWCKDGPMKSCGLVYSFSQESIFALKLKWAKVGGILDWTNSRK